MLFRSVGRIVGEKTGALTLNNNYARADLLYGKGEPHTMGTVSYADSYIRGIQGENIPYELPDSEYTTKYHRYTEEDIKTAYDAFNARYLMPSNIYVEKVGQSKVAAIWVQAIYYDVAMNAYKRTGSKEAKKLMDDIYLGNYNRYAQYDWDNGPVWFIYDDIMWWVISLARAYELTGDEKYLERSETGFERVWSGSPVVGDNGSYDPVRGGMYWAWDQQNPVGSPDPGMGKMACINYPTVVAAMTLYNCTKNEKYLNKAKEIYEWSNKNLFNPKNGRVPDSNHNGGISNWHALVYNQGTCIGAAMMLYKETGDVKYLDDAILTANYTKNQMSNNGAMPFENGIEQGIYTAIFSQYIIRLIEDGKQYQYLPWLWYNIDSAWENRNKSQNITDKNHIKPARSLFDIESYDASGIPALMQVIPPAIDADKEVYCKNRTFYENNLRWDVGGVWKLSDSGLPMLLYTKCY